MTTTMTTSATFAGHLLDVEVDEDFAVEQRTHPIRQRRPSRPQPGLEGRRHAKPRI
ncbi:hypothetical protein ACH4VR_40790 [Streptomyces sp. NPDC020883]|uniref:hypothetical protein n=1 Tax=Streptomyces sp. NPDC020883 TaxID=3365099 RepID=UPI0037A84E9D